MLFDARTALAEILKAQPQLATTATIATNHPAPPNLSRMSQVSQPALSEIGNPPTTCPETFDAPGEPYPHGRDINGNPKTWTGRSVIPAVWKSLSDWERNGSTGQLWSGHRRAWEPSDVLNLEGKRNDH